MLNAHSIEYVTEGPMTMHQVLEKASSLIKDQLRREDMFRDPNKAKTYLQFKLGAYEREVFSLLLLDSAHQLIDYQELFYGTVNAASVYPREVVKAALKANAASIILAHNHPSGLTEPSQADRLITDNLVQALDLIDVKVLDHIIVGKECLSFAERGYL